MHSSRVLSSTMPRGTCRRSRTVTHTRRTRGRSCRASQDVEMVARAQRQPASRREPAVALDQALEARIGDVVRVPGPAFLLARALAVVAVERELRMLAQRRAAPVPRRPRETPRSPDRPWCARRRRSHWRMISSISRGGTWAATAARTVSSSAAWLFAMVYARSARAAACACRARAGSRCP